MVLATKVRRLQGVPDFFRCPWLLLALGSVLKKQLPPKTVPERAGERMRKTDPCGSIIECRPVRQRTDDRRQRRRIARFAATTVGRSSLAEVHDTLPAASAALRRGAEDRRNGGQESANLFFRDGRQIVARW